MDPLEEDPIGDDPLRKDSLGDIMYPLHFVRPESSIQLGAYAQELQWASEAGPEQDPGPQLQHGIPQGLQI